MDYLPFLFTGFFLSPGLNAPNLIFGWLAIAPLYIWLYQKTASAIIIVYFNVIMQFTFNTIPVLPVDSGDNSAAAMVNLVLLGTGFMIWHIFPPDKPNNCNISTHNRPDSQPKSPQ
jgi:hypothetical protein